MARPLKFFLGVTLCIVGLLAVALALSSKPGPLPALPNPNGYDDLVKAGRLVADGVSDWGTMNAEELRGLVSSNRQALALGRTGLGRECRARLDYNPTNEVFFQDLTLLKRLAQAFAAEGKLAELEHRTNDATACYLDAIRLGHQGSRGGILIYSLVGIVAESIGITRLELLARTLDAKQCHEVLATLEPLESHRESCATVLAHEHEWSRRVFGLKGQVARLLTYRSLRQSEQRVQSKLQAQQLRTARFMVGLAARVFELEKGNRPNTLAELVPAYLKAIPQDPVSGTNLIYRP